MSVAYEIRLLRRKRPKLKISSVKELNRRIKLRKRARNKAQLRLDKIALQKYGELIKHSEIKNAELSLNFNCHFLEQYQQAKKSLKRRRQPSKQAYFGRGI